MLFHCLHEKQTQRAVTEDYGGTCRVGEGGGRRLRLKDQEEENMKAKRREEGVKRMKGWETKETMLVSSSKEFSVCETCLATQAQS